jgi:hypothetical protein
LVAPLLGLFAGHWRRIAEPTQPAIWLLSISILVIVLGMAARQWWFGLIWRDCHDPGFWVAAWTQIWTAMLSCALAGFAVGFWLWAHWSRSKAMAIALSVAAGATLSAIAFMLFFLLAMPLGNCVPR